MKKVTWFYIFILVGLWITFILPIFFFNQDICISIHDNLDETAFISRVVLEQTGQMFNFNPFVKVDAIMNGIPRGYLSSSLNIFSFLVVLFPPFTAYAINYYLVHAVAFIGMYLCLIAIFRNRPHIKLIALMVSASYSVLPFFTTETLSVAGIPLLIYAFYNLYRSEKKLISFGIILFFVLYSSLYHIGVLTMGVVIFFMIYLTIIKRINKYFLIGFFFLTLGYIIVEFPTIRLILSDVTHRVERDPTRNSSTLMNSLWNIYTDFTQGQFHAPSYNQYILAILIPIAIGTRILYKKSIKELFLFLGVILLISLIYGFYSWDLLLPLFEKNTLLRIFNFSRLNWFHPALWYIVFALACIYIVETNHKLAWVVVMVFSVFQLGFVLIQNPEYVQFINKVNHQSSYCLTYKRFFATGLFSEIKQYIAEPQETYRVVSLGIPPAVAQYNQFYSLDSYQNLYQLAYKHEFRKIIAGELAKSDYWRVYFDQWGNQSYIFSSEITPKIYYDEVNKSTQKYFSGHVEDLLYTKDINKTINHLDLDLTQLYKMGGRYIISAIKLNNINKHNLKLLKVFENSDSIYRIYLYKIISEDK